MAINLTTADVERRDEPGAARLPAEEEPLVSIVVPCLNEELCIGEFVDWCFEGLRRAGVTGEVVIVDSGTDRSGEIAEAHGARVLHFPRRGLGRAYIDALPHIRGRWVIMGDCDLTYDFREIERFVARFREGFDFVMGSRFGGYIEHGAMPALHRYFGTPLTTWILNRIYGTYYGDIHCGMRGITREALRRIELRSQSWEYASEMVVKAAKLRLRACEVPVRFYKDREGRVSHHKRTGWFSPWQAGWINLKAMFLFAPEFFLRRPGWAMLLVGLALAVSLAGGSYTLFGVGMDLHWMLLGMTLAAVGYGALQLATLARVFYDFDPLYTERIRRRITFDRGLLAGIGLGAVGLGINGASLVRYVYGGLRLEHIQYGAVFGLLLIVLGFQTFTFTLLLHMILQRRRDPDA
jgi:glycosyltransferase involved in cell wall biosynthesis